MKNEIWRPVVGYEGLYEVSNLGRVKSIRKGERLLKPGHDRRGYLQVVLSKSSTTRTYKVHRLVWTAFNGPIPEGMQVNHINEVKTDNRLCNINLMTPKENMNWGTRTQRVSKPVIQYDLAGNVVKGDWSSTMEIQRQTGYLNNNISDCCRGKRKTYKGYIWRYKPVE